MKPRMALVLVFLALAGARNSLAAEHSGVAVLPTGSNLELLFASARELFQHEGYKIDTADPHSGRLVSSVQLYQTQNVGGSGGLVEEWRRWTLLLTRSAGGEVRIEIAVSFSAFEEKTPFDIAWELRNILSGGTGVDAAKVRLTIDGVEKPLLEWKR
jgi:hypothetical protein